MYCAISGSGQVFGRRPTGHDRRVPCHGVCCIMKMLLQPSNDVQQGLKERITQVATDLAQTRLLLFSHLSSSIPLPFLAVLMLWMVVLFAGFSLMAPANATTFAALLICALSVSGAIFLILELDQPFSGLMAVRSEALINALPPLP